MIRKPAEVFGRDDIYDATFCESLLQVDVRALVLAYKSEKAMGSLIEEMIAGRIRDLGVLRWTKRSMWGLALAAVLNHQERERWLAAWFAA
jgi:hypothetical protein